MSTNFNVLKKRVTTGLKTNLRKYRFDLKYLGIDLFLVIVIVTLSYNIYLAYSKGVDNVTRIRNEEQVLAELISKNEELTELERYYSSNEYTKIYARESLNLAGEGETLYVIDRIPVKQTNPKTLEKLQEKMDNHSHWWKSAFNDYLEL